MGIDEEREKIGKSCSEKKVALSFDAAWGNGKLG